MEVLNKKAYFFTIDSVIALSVIIAILSGASHFYPETGPLNLIATEDHYARDLVNILANIKVSEINNSYVSELIANGDITNLNNTLLEQIGEFWNQDEMTLARNLAENVSYGLIPSSYSFGVWAGNEHIYSQNNSEAVTLVSAKKLISGVTKAKPIAGYISRAWARKIVKNTTLVVSWSPEGSGWYGSGNNRGEVEIDKQFVVPLAANISSAALFVSLHNDVGGDDWEIININGGQCGINRDELDTSGEGIFDIKDVTGCINPGNNSVKLRLRNAGYNSHIHPGMRLEIRYYIIEEEVAINESVTKRFYFDNVVSKEGSSRLSGSWAVLPFYIPEDAREVKAKLHLTVRDVEDILDRYWSGGWKYQDAWDVQVYVNSDSVFWQDNASASSDINDRYYDGTYDLEEEFNISSEIINGTNIVSVYVNSFGDTVGGEGNTTIYSDMFNDPDNSSYVEVSYLQSPEFIYGTVGVTSVEEFGGYESHDKTISFNIGETAKAILNSFVHVAQRFSYYVYTYSEQSSPPQNLIFESPSPRAVPTTILVPKDTLVISDVINNYVRVRDQNSGNDILPESSIEYTILVDSQVSYGDVFSTPQESEQDALIRLNQTLGQYAQALDVELQSNEIKDVPSLWGPTVIEVRVWR